MKTWHIRRDRNMFRASSDQKVVEKCRKTLLYLCPCVRGYQLVYAALIHAYIYLTHAYVGSLHMYMVVFFRLHKRMIQLAYACSAPAYIDADLHTHTGTQKPYFDCFGYFFTYFLARLSF